MTSGYARIGLQTNQSIHRFGKFTDGNATSLLDELGDRIVLGVGYTDEFAPIVENSRQTTFRLERFHPINDVLYSQIIESTKLSNMFCS
jgi:hypothetical protein